MADDDASVALHRTRTGGPRQKSLLLLVVGIRQKDVRCRAESGDDYAWILRRHYASIHPWRRRRRRFNHQRRLHHILSSPPPPPPPPYTPPLFPILLIYTYTCLRFYHFSAQARHFRPLYRGAAGAISRGRFASKVVVSFETCRKSVSSRTPWYRSPRPTFLHRRDTFALSIGVRRGC